MNACTRLNRSLTYFSLIPCLSCVCLRTTVCRSGRGNNSHVGRVPPPVGQEERMVCARPSVRLLSGRPLHSYLRKSNSTANKNVVLLWGFSFSSTSNRL